MMKNEDFNLDDYQNKSHFELLEIATKEQDIKKRKALFELANKILEKGFENSISGGDT